MNNEKWEELYMVAATEVDGKRVPERVAAVREAIRARLLDLETSSDHHEERGRLASSLKRLGWLEVEAQKW
jgi:hypothetical protein